MKTATQLALVCGLVIGAALGGLAIRLNDTIYMRKMAVKNECGHYDYHTGDFIWNLATGVAITEEALTSGGIQLPAQGDKNVSPADPKKGVYSPLQPRGRRPK